MSSSKLKKKNKTATKPKKTQVHEKLGKQSVSHVKKHLRPFC